MVIHIEIHRLFHSSVGHQPEISECMPSCRSPSTNGIFQRSAGQRLATECHSNMCPPNSDHAKPNSLNHAQNSAIFRRVHTNANGCALFHVKRCASSWPVVAMERCDPPKRIREAAVGVGERKPCIPRVIHRVFHCSIHRCIHSHAPPGWDLRSRDQPASTLGHSQTCGKLSAGFDQRAPTIVGATARESHSPMGIRDGSPFAESDAVRPERSDGERHRPLPPTGQLVVSAGRRWEIIGQGGTLKGLPLGAVPI